MHFLKYGTRPWPSPLLQTVNVQNTFAHIAQQSSTAHKTCGLLRLPQEAADGIDQRKLRQKEGMERTRNRVTETNAMTASPQMRWLLIV